MPVPSFWPEKATEWVALIGGVFGGVLGTLAFIMAILNYRRDRAKLAFYAQQLEPEPIVPLDFDETQDYDSIVFPDNVIFKLRVTNLGRRPIRIEEAWAVLNGPRPALLLQLEAGENKEGPPGIALTESEPSATYVTRGYIRGFSLNDFVRFEIYDSAFREHRYYHRGYFRTRLSQIPYWISDFRRKREMRRRFGSEG